MIPGDCMYVENVRFAKYMNALVGRIFKILPLWEEGSVTLPEYMSSLQLELVGLYNFEPEIHDDELFLSIIATLQYLIDHPECKTGTVKREVFRSIGVCNTLRDRYKAVVE